MKKCDKREKIENDKWLKDFQREVLKHHICSNCPEFNCEHNVYNNYFTYLMAMSRQSSRDMSPQIIELLNKAIQMKENKGSK